MSKARPRLIFLYGPPAVGKLTVARAIAERRDVRVLHNHVTFDPVAEVLPPGTSTFWATLDKVRVELVTAAACEGIDLVYTFVFAPGDERHVDDVVSAYESAGGSVVFVQLVAPPDELRRRVCDVSRAAHNKIRDAASLDDVLREHDVYAPIPGRDSLTIDVAAISPEEAASRIGEHVDALSAEDDGCS
jgi:chloramphenicol 3-O-phosphotransferase